MTKDIQLSASKKNSSNQPDRPELPSTESQQVSLVSKIGRAVLSILRILLGAIFVAAGTSKIVSGALGSAQMLSFLEEKQAITFPFYSYFIEALVLQFPLLFAGLVAFGETALGLSLLLGAKVRLSTSLGIIMVTNFMLAKGGYPWQLGGDQLFIVLLLAFLLSNAGRHWGLDGYWSNKQVYSS